MENKTKPGEKGFAVILLAFGAIVLWQGILMFQKTPKLSSYGAMPLILGIMLTLCSTIIIVQNFNRKSEIAGRPLSEKVSKTLGHLLKQDVLVMILLLIAYSVALFAGLRFVYSTPIYLWVTISYLTRKNYAKNILYTAIVMAFIMVVFKILFRIILP